jgi:3-hydroxybutyryl-CoA dehydrogenase
MGPFELIDMIGLDVNLAVTRSVFEATAYDRRYAPSLIQQELVRAGRYGRKSGRGFHRYGEGAPAPQPATAALAEPVRSVHAVGNLGPAHALADRLQARGLLVQRVPGDGPGYFQIGRARVALTDGRGATQRAAEEGVPDLVLFDLAADYMRAQRIAVARADQCSAQAFGDAVGALQAAGVAVSPLDDAPALAVMRTACTLANEAADLIAHGVASAADVDTAMQLGVSYPKGPLAWADELTPAFVAQVLDHLRAHYGEERYRVSPALQRRRFSGHRFHA